MASDLFDKAFKDVETKAAICPKCPGKIGMELVTKFRDNEQYWECTTCWHRIDLVVKGKTV